MIVGCDDQEGTPVPIVPCNKHLLWALPAPVGGRLYVRVRGNGVLHTPLHDERPARRNRRGGPPMGRQRRATRRGGAGCGSRRCRHRG
jgi:hypothetical protein